MTNRRLRTKPGRGTNSIKFDDATELLRQPGCTLVEMKTNTKYGHQFFIVPGGPVDEVVAKQLLERPLCHEVDSGLFPGIPQSYSLYHGT